MCAGRERRRRECARRERGERVGDLRSTSAAVFRARAMRPAWLNVVSTYVMCSRDRFLGQGRQRQMAYRIIRSQLARNRVVDHALSLDSGHCPFFSRPAGVAAAIAADSWLPAAR